MPFLPSISMLSVAALLSVAAAAAQQAAPKPEAAPALTMAPHPDVSRYWLSGQANIVFQGNLPFHSPYAGANSFQAGAQYRPRWWARSIPA